jgi:hypothetical protein
MPINEEILGKITEKFGADAETIVASLNDSLSNDVTQAVENTKKEHQSLLDQSSTKVSEFEKANSALLAKAKALDELKGKLAERGYDGISLDSIKAKQAADKKVEESDEYKKVAKDNSILNQQIAKITESQETLANQMKLLETQKAEADAHAAKMDMQATLTNDLKDYGDVGQLLIKSMIASGEVYKKDGKTVFKVEGREDIPDTYEEGMTKIKEKYKNHYVVSQNTGGGSQGGSDAAQNVSVEDQFAEAQKWMNKRKGK